MQLIFPRAKLKIFSVMSVGLLLLISSSVSKAAGIPGVPEIPVIPAFLPTIDQVMPTQPMPLDGVWLIPTIGKKINIDSGRAYAVDGWLHLFVLDIKPGMVVIKNIMPTGPGQYAGEDLPLMGKFSAKVQADQSLAVTVAGMFGPISYKLVPVQLNNYSWYQQEMKAAGLVVSNGNNQLSAGYQFSDPNRNQSSYQPNTHPQQNYQPQVYPTQYNPAPYNSSQTPPTQDQKQPSENASPLEANKEPLKCSKVEYHPDDDTYTCIELEQ